MKKSKLCSVFLAILVFSTGVGCSKSKNNISNDAYPQPLTLELNEEAFLAIVESIRPLFLRLEQEFSSDMNHFHNWFVDLLEICKPAENKLVFAVLDLRGELTKIHLFRPWCELASNDKNTSLFPYLSLLSPYDISRTRRDKTFNSYEQLVHDELIRSESDSFIAPHHYIVFLKQLYCTYDAHTQTLLSFFDEWLDFYLDQHEFESLSLDNVTQYYRIFDQNGMMPSIHLWRVYEHLAEISL